MGIIKRQSLKRTGITYVGVIIGTLSNLFIYPLSWNTYGLAQFIISCSALLLPLATMGVPNVAVKYFSRFNSSDNKSNLFFTVLLITLVGTLFTLCLLLYVFESIFFDILEMLQMDLEVFYENTWVVIIVLSFLTVSSLLTQYISNYKRVVVPVIFSNLLHKLVLPTLVICVAFQYLDIVQFKVGFVILYFVSAIGLLWYLLHLKSIRLRFHFSQIKFPLAKEMSIFALYSFLTVIGITLAFRIDGIMVTSYLGYEANGYYSFFLFMTNVIIIPYSSIIAIANPIIAQAWSENNISEIDTIYRKSSINLTVAGLLILLNIWLCMDDILSLTENLKALIPYKNVFLLLAIGQLVNMLSGPNELIIAHSKYFRFNFITILVLGVLAVYLNKILIPGKGLIGAAYATAFSLFSHLIS